MLQAMTFYVLLGWLSLHWIGMAFAKDGRRPNIVFILADDLGYMDVAAYAARTLEVDRGELYYETPHIDRLVQEGIAFSQAYANQLCSPTRASLLTGQYAAKLGVTTATPGNVPTYYNQGQTPPPGYLEQDAIRHADPITQEQAWINGRTLTALLSGQPQDNGRDIETLAELLSGYDSAFLGKWHLGGHGSQGYQPRDQGFHEIAYLDSGSSPFFKWRPLWNSRKLRFPSMRQDKLQHGFAGSKTGRDYLTSDLTEQALSYLQERSAEPEKPFFLYFCHFAVHAPLQAQQADIDYFQNKSTRGFNGHANPTYAAMVKALDDSVGAVLKKLRDTGLADNTIVVFMSDNGGVDWQLGKAGVPTSNTPFKGGKATLYEGGIRVPLIFWNPQRINAGRWCETPVHCNDIVPTLLELADQRLPQDLDGESLVPLFSDPTNAHGAYVQDTFYWHYPFNVIVNHPDYGMPLTPHSAVRQGDHKLIFDWHGELRLYDIATDPTEQHNLAADEPDRTSEMFRMLCQWLDENVEARYLPVLNPDYEADKDPRPYPFVDLRRKYGFSSPANSL